MTISEEERQLMARFKEETDKNAIWRGTITKGYIAWKKKLKARTIGKTSKPKSMSLINIEEKINQIFKKLDQLDQRVQLLERNNSSSKKIRKSPKFSGNYFLRILNLVYASIEERYGDFVLISTLTESVKQYIPWSTQEIHSELYRLFMDYKIDLQPGKNIKGEPLRQDGNIFVWFKFK